MAVGDWQRVEHLGEDDSRNHPGDMQRLVDDHPLIRALSGMSMILSTQDRDLRYTWLCHPEFDDADVLGKRDADLLSSADADLLTSIKQRVLDTGQPVRETVHLTIEGKRTVYDLSVEPMYVGNDYVAGVTSAAIDITRHNRMENEHQFHSTVLKSIYDSVIVTDLAGRITYWNRGAEDIFGYTATEMLGKTLEVLYPQGGLEDVAADLSSIAAGNDYHGEWCGVRKDGELVWLDVRTTALRDASGDMVGYVGVGKDATARKYAEQSKDELLRREQARRRRLRQFLALVAHDLRSPLATIFGYTQLLERGALSRESGSYAQATESVRAASMLLQRLANDLSDAAAAGEGRFAIQAEQMDLVSVAHGVVAESQSGSARHNVQLHAPPELHGEWDPQRMHQLLGNLVDNAIKYSPQGGEVTVRVEDDGDEVLLTVQDAGIGIAAGEQMHLFDIFTRGEDADDVMGFGLGLYICRAIVEAHGGRIDVQSELGNGSTFQVRLPRVSPTTR